MHVTAPPSRLAGVVMGGTLEMKKDDRVVLSYETEVSALGRGSNVQCTTLAACACLQ
jgi:hypothetical protein